MMQLGLLETDPNWPHANHRPGGITRRFVLSMAIMSVALVLLGLPLVQIGLAMFTPIPFEYRNLPFKVCSPRSTPEVCIPLAQGESFQAGDIVPFLVDRCATDVFARSTVMPYIVSRNVVNDVTGVRVILPSLATELPAGGCQVTLTVAHQLPDTLPPGRYYLEGVATVYGRFRTVNAYFRTETFQVFKTP
jgi:hypothetical protein